MSSAFSGVELHLLRLARLRSDGVVCASELVPSQVEAMSRLVSARLFGERPGGAFVLTTDGWELAHGELAR